MELYCVLFLSAILRMTSSSDLLKGVIIGGPWPLKKIWIDSLVLLDVISARAYLPVELETHFGKCQLMVHYLQILFRKLFQDCWGSNGHFNQGKVDVLDPLEFDGRFKLLLRFSSFLLSGHGQILNCFIILRDISLNILKDMSLYIQIMAIKLLTEGQSWANLVAWGGSRWTLFVILHLEIFWFCLIYLFLIFV